MAWNRPKEREQEIGNREQEAWKFLFRGLVAGAIIVLGAAVAAWWLWSSGEKAGVTPPTRARQQIKEVSPSFSTTADKIAKVEPKRAEEQEFDPSVAKTNGIVSALNPEGRLFLSVVSNSTGMILTTYRRADGSMVEVLDRAHPAVRRTAADQLLDMAINHPNGPPLPVDPNDRSLDEVFKKSLEKKIEIKADDSAAIRSLKERMIAARNEMSELMNNSTASFSEIIEAHQRSTKENSALLNEVQGAINDCLKKGDKDGAGQIYSQFSGQLEQLGITGLTLDPELENEEEQP